MQMSKKQMAMVAFLQAQNCSNLTASWRHPDTQPGYLTAEYYQHIGRVLERGKFHLAFFDDRLAMPDAFGGDHMQTVAHGIRAVKLDPMTMLTAIALATSRLGLGCTYSTTYHDPYHVARVFATLDLVSHGRAAWNVVTSLNDSEARNFGLQEHAGHDLRYDRADEFMEVVLGHWDTWQEGALIGDTRTGQFADPSRVRRLDHEGKWFKSRGPFTVPRSEQGQPVLIQAGQSGRGSDFAARWGELVFVIYPNLEIAKKRYAEFKRKLAEHGRDPDSVRVAPAIYVVVADTQAQAEERKAAIDKLVRPEDSLVLLSEVLNFDFSRKQPDDEFTHEELESISGLRAIVDRVIQLSGKTNPTLRDFLEYSGRGTMQELPTFVGDPRQVADQLERWFVEGACDGFVLAAASMPGSYEDFVRLVVPELQRRGIYQEDYAGSTLRENLGLARPDAGDWKQAHR
jgi:FMN-dependent oxidoreductase (nitrilotriacetate monooxygenase family)